MMKNIENKLGLDDLIGLSNIQNYLKIYDLGKEELGNDELYDNIHNHSKCGYLVITKVSDNPGFGNKGFTEDGWCPILCKGLSCRIENSSTYYYTSNIVDIDWENGTFNTLNSKYKFTLKPYTVEELKTITNDENTNCK